MKHIVSKINIFLVSFILLFSLSCTNNIDSDKTYLTLSVSIESARTIFPENYEVEKLTDFVLTNKNGDILGKWGRYKDFARSEIEVNINGFEDTFILYAKCGNLWLKDSVTAVLKPGNNTLNFKLNIIDYETKGYGNVSITLKMPVSKVVESSSFALIDYDDFAKYFIGTATEPVVEDDYITVNFNAENVPTGFYRLYVQSKLTDGTFASHSDTVYVISNKTSFAEYECLTYIKSELPTKEFTIHFCDGDTILDELKILKSEIFFDYYYSRVCIYDDIHYQSFTVPKKDGYVFAGWYTDPECSNGNKIDLSNKITITEDTCLYAKWNSAVIITFNTNGGSLFDPILVRKNAEVSFNIYNDVIQIATFGAGAIFDAEYKAPTKTGYLFAGWYTDSDCSIGNEAYRIIVTEDITFYAKWKPVSPQSIITFNTNGGSLFGSKKIETGDTIIFDYYFSYFWFDSRYNNPTKSGYVFAGWYTDAECSDDNKVDYSNRLTVTEDITLYAKWKPAVKITFNTNRVGSFDSETVGMGDKIYFNYNVSNFDMYINDLNHSESRENPAPDYLFAGWYTDEECSDGNLVDESNPITITEDITLYAKWNSPVNIHFDTNGGSTINSKSVVTGEKIYFEYEYSYFNLKIYGVSNKYANPTKTGYLFAGWYTNSECSGSKVDNSNRITVTEDITLYAKWIPSSRIIFNTNGGSAIAAVEIEIGKKVYFHYKNSYFLLRLENELDLSFNNPTKNGYLFGGWYTDAECSEGNKIDDSNKITVTEEIILYAKWNPAVTITFDLNGNVYDETFIKSKTIESGTVIYFYEDCGRCFLYINDIESFNWEEPYRPGYIFAGWYTDAECSDGNLVDEANPITITEDITLYAKWIKYF